MAAAVAVATASTAVELIGLASCLRPFDAGESLGNLLLRQPFLLQKGDALRKWGLLDLRVLQKGDPIQDEVLAGACRGGGRRRRVVVVHPCRLAM